MFSRGAEYAYLGDRTPTKPIYLGCLVLSGVSALAFAFLAEGFWIALVLRTIGGVGLGLMAEARLWKLTLVTILYDMLLTGDFASITAGTVAEALTGYKGATLAVHSCIGFIGSFLGPLIFGVALDVASLTSVGGTTVVVPGLGPSPSAQWSLQ